MCLAVFFVLVSDYSWEFFCAAMLLFFYSLCLASFVQVRASVSFNRVFESELYLRDAKSSGEIEEISRQPHALDACSPTEICAISPRRPPPARPDHKPCASPCTSTRGSVPSMGGERHRGYHITPGNRSTHAKARTGFKCPQACCFRGKAHRSRGLYMHENLPHATKGTRHKPKPRTFCCCSLPAFDGGRGDTRMPRKMLPALTP